MAEINGSPRSSWQRRLRQRSVKLALATMLLALVAAIPVLPGIRGAAADDLPVHLQAFPTGTPCGYEDSWHAPRGTDANGNPLYHEGVDIIAKTGVPIYAVSDGTITRMSTSTRGGTQLYLTRADKTYFFHAHLSAYAAGLKVGDRVAAGQLVAYVGQTGDAQYSVPHLHFEVHPAGGAPVNPYPIVKEVDACYSTSPTTTPPKSGTTAPATSTAPAPATTTAPPAAQPAGTVTAEFANLTTITPTRFADTRSKFWLHRLVPGEVQALTIAGRNGVPADATMAALNLTVTNPLESGYVVAFPCGHDAPKTSSINFAAGRTIANAAMVGLGNGKVCVTTKVVTDLVVDVSGWQGPGAGLRLTPTVPTRLVDTRDGRRLHGGQTLVVSVPSSPVAARAATFGDASATGDNPTGDASTGDASTGGDIGSSPFTRSDKVAVIATTLPTSAPRATTATLPSGDAPAPAPPPDSTVAPPTTAAPTPGTTVSPGVTPPTPGTSTSHPQAVSLNVTSVGAAGAGFLTVWPCDAGRPTASNLNVAGGDIVPNTVTVGVSASGTVCVYSQSATDVVVDLTGSWSATAGLAVAPVAPARLLDTRTAGGALKPGQVVRIDVAGVGAVPGDVVAVQVNLTATDTVNDGYLTVWPCGNSRPTASNLNPIAGGTVANGATVGLTGGTLCLYSSTTTQVIVDLTAVMR